MAQIENYVANHPGPLHTADQLKMLVRWQLSSSREQYPWHREISGPIAVASFRNIWIIRDQSRLLQGYYLYFEFRSPPGRLLRCVPRQVRRDGAIEFRRKRGGEIGGIDLDPERFGAVVTPVDFVYIARGNWKAEPAASRPHQAARDTTLRGSRCRWSRRCQGLNVSHDRRQVEP